MRPVGQKQGMVLPRIVQAKWCCRQDDETDICSAADDRQRHVVWVSSWEQ